MANYNLQSLTLPKILFNFSKFTFIQFGLLIFNFVQFSLFVTLCQNLAVKDLHNYVILHWTKFEVNSSILTGTNERIELNKIESSKAKLNKMKLDVASCNLAF